MISRFLILLIQFYRWTISPFTQPRCRFDPTCSRYAIHSIQHHGPIKGLFLTLKRLLKCHPFKRLGSDQGYDPAPLPSTQQSSLSKRHSALQQ